MSQAHQKQTKYNYLQHSFERELQRSYDRKNQGRSPSSVNSPSLQSPQGNKNYFQKYNQAYNELSRQRQRSPPRSSQFSPYQNKQENVRDKILVQELKNHNRVLSQQIQEYKVMLDKMQVELRVRVEEFGALETVRQKERLIQETTVKQMREQIGILLTKNAFLEERNIILEREVKKYECEITKNEARTRSLSAVAATTKSSTSKLIQQILSLLHSTNPPQKPRQHGKLLNQTFSNLPSTSQSPSPSTPSSPHLPQTQILTQIQSLTHRIKKYEQLTESISEMYYKITKKKFPNSGSGVSGLELKSIWKWLKQLGHNFNIVQKCKKMLVDVLQLQEKDGGEEWSVEEVLQKAVVHLHSK